MNCKQTGVLISALIDGALDAQERVAIETHCAGCAACKATYLRYLRTDALFAPVASVKTTASFETRLSERITQRQEIERLSFFELIGIEKKLLIGCAACSLLISTVTLNLYAAYDYAQLQSYVAGSAGIQSTESDDIVAYLIDGNA
jgi:anti-sigma factor RsiW